MFNAPLAKLNHKITVIDAPCGSGKTATAINNLCEGKQYLFVTPLLSEVQRVIENSPVPFIEPQGSKKVDLKNLLAAGNNVVTTHACYRNLSVSDAELLSDVELIIDEAIETVSAYSDVNLSDFYSVYIEGSWVTIDDANRITPTLKWDDKMANNCGDTLSKGLYEDSKNHALYYVDGKFILWQFPLELLCYCKTSTILTYQWYGSVAHFYLRKHKVEVKVDKQDDSQFKRQVKELLTIKDIPAISKLKFSKTAQEQHKITEYKKVRNFLMNLKTRELKDVKSTDILITCLKKNWFKNERVKKTGENRQVAKGGYAINSRLTVSANRTPP
jgi:hypothetical protein